MILGREARRRPVHLVLVALACAVLALAALPALAAADTYLVNLKSVGPGCTVGSCTLPGAIEAANSHQGEDTIEFDPAVFGGAAPQSTITLSTSLPQIDEKLTILGGTCPTGWFVGSENVQGPCVELTLNATATTPIFQVEGEEVTIQGLALNGAGYGIQAQPGAEGLTVTGDWFGAGLNNGTGTANATAGVRLEREADEAVIGGATASPRNVFYKGGTGVEIVGASGAKVAGNWFGLRPDGAFPVGSSVEVGVSIGNETHVTPTVQAENDEVGGVLGKAESETNACDGACNVFAMEVDGTAIDLSGEGGEAATGPTLVRGNYVGLSPDGLLPFDHQAEGVFTGPALPNGPGPGGVTIGGADAATEGNYFVGGSGEGVKASKAAGLAVLGNHFGYLRDGLASDPADLAVSSAGLAKGATIQANSIFAGNKGFGIASVGPGSEIVDNRIEGGNDAIKTEGDVAGVGNLIEGNTITGAEAVGVFAENSLNEVVGNTVTGGEVGLRIDGEDATHQSEGNVLTGNAITNAGHVGIEVGSESTHSRIGGDGPGEANAIVGAGNLIGGQGAGAITIRSRQEGRTEVAANTGSGNAQKFITLITHGGAEEPNGGIKPPTIATALQSSATGTGARPNATIRIFSKASAEAGELGKLLAVVSADAAGNWSTTYATQPVGTLVVATQTQEGATSELSATRAAAADPTPPPSGNPGSGSTSPAPTTATPAPIAAPAPKPVKPTVKIAKGPKKTSSATKATFKFKAEPATGASFECKLDGGKWAKCSSPKTYSSLKPGRHTFRVRAKANGLTGPVTKYQFKIEG